MAQVKAKRLCLAGQFRGGKITCPVCGKEGFMIAATKQVLHTWIAKSKRFRKPVKESSICNLLEAA